MRKVSQLNQESADAKMTKTEPAANCFRLHNISDIHICGVSRISFITYLSR